MACNLAAPLAFYDHVHAAEDINYDTNTQYHAQK